jgi:hypothetical protein
VYNKEWNTIRHLRSPHRSIKALTGQRGRSSSRQQETKEQQNPSKISELSTLPQIQTLIVKIMIVRLLD